MFICLVLFYMEVSFDKINTTSPSKWNENIDSQVLFIRLYRELTAIINRIIYCIETLEQ